MSKLLFINRFLCLLVFLLLVVACENTSPTKTLSDFDKLCTIYKETLQKDISPDMQAYEIATRAKKEVPDILGDLQHISMANPEDAYPLFKKVAENATKKPWECKVMKDYYDRAYKKKLERNLKEKN